MQEPVDEICKRDGSVGFMNEEIHGMIGTAHPSAPDNGRVKEGRRDPWSEL
jgi:hypothetical protein